MGIRKIQIDEYNNIVNLYMEGKTQDFIANVYGVGRTTIKRILTKMKVCLRDHSHKRRIYNINENYFDSIDTPNKAYILGLLYSDGCNAESTNTIKLELQEKDKEILEKIREELNYDAPLACNPLHEKNQNWKDCYRLCITNKHMSETLARLGMMANKSLILKFPEWLSPDLIPHFIRGYLDGDGHIEWSRTRFISIAATVDFCEYLQSYLLSTLGIKTSIYNIGNKDTSTRSINIFSKDNIYNFLNYIYKEAELYINRKYETYQSICKEMKNK